MGQCFLVIIVLFRDVGPSIVHTNIQKPNLSKNTRKSSCVNAKAYRPPCSEYSFCCPTRVPPPPPRGGYPGTPPGGVPDLGTPPGGYLTRVPPPRGGYLTRVPPRGGTGPGYPPGGYLTRVPPRGGGTRTPPPPRCGQTNKVKLLPSRRTTYAGGNEKTKIGHFIWLCYL